MRRSSLVTTITLAGALAFCAAPAFAQRGGGGGGHMGGGGGGRMGGGGSAGGRMGGGQMGGGGHVGGGRISGAPAGGGMRGSGQVFTPGAGVPRGSAGVRGGTFNGGTFNRGTFNGGTFNRGSWNGRSWNVAPLHYYRPYYAFRPHFSLGFGLWSGYPVGWAYPFYIPPYPYYPNYPYYPYPYPYEPVGPGYSVAPPEDETPDTTPNEAVGTAGVEPDQSNLGGMSFEITPSDAQVFVDGNYVGTVGEFTPTTQPLGVPSGRHHVEIRDDGYQTMSFDVDIVAGQVIPYQGQMER